MIYVSAVTKDGCFHIENDHLNFDECWIYIGPAYWIKGYPIIRRHGKNWIVSRFVWYFFTHRDYHGKDVHHKCHTRACCNPLHLEEVSSRKHRKFHGFKRKR